MHHTCFHTHIFFMLLMTCLLQACVNKSSMAPQEPLTAHSHIQEVSSETLYQDVIPRLGRLLGGVQGTTSVAEVKQLATPGDGPSSQEQWSEVSADSQQERPNKASVTQIKKTIATLYAQLPQDPEQVRELLVQLKHLLTLERTLESEKGEKAAREYLEKIIKTYKNHPDEESVPIYSELTALLEKAYSQELTCVIEAKQFEKAPKNTKKLVQVLDKLAKLHQQQGDQTGTLHYYTDAAVHYQIILQVCNRDKQADYHHEIKAAYEGLTQINAAMITCCKAKGSSLGVADLQSQIKNDRKVLQDLRADVKSRVNQLEAALHEKGMTPKQAQKAEKDYIEGSQKLFEDIAKKIRAFVVKLYREAEQVLGPAPCKYAVMGLGSMALQQMTPYSDLEFAILMEKPSCEVADGKYRAYLRKLTHLVHFRVINIGETVIPISKYGVSLDHLCSVGFNFDLGGKTPLGRPDKPYSLIQPVDVMLAYLRTTGKQIEDKFLPFILETTCYVHGNKALYKEYEEKKQSFLVQTRTAQGIPVHRARAQRMYKEDLVEKERVIRVGDIQRLQPKFHDMDAGRLYNVKQEIYRLPDRLLYGLAMYYGILSKSGWDAVAQMYKREIINSDALCHLQYAVSFATMLRLKTYLHHGQQVEQITVRRDNTTTLKEMFALTAAALEPSGSLFKYYYVVLPFHSKMEALLSHRELTTNQATNFFRTESFHDATPETIGKIYYRLLQPQKALAYWQQALERLLGIQARGEHLKKVATIYQYIGMAYSSLGKYPEALHHYEQSLQLQAAFHYPDQHPDVANSYHHLGVVYAFQGKFSKAMTYCNESLNLRLAIYGHKAHPVVASSYHSVGTIYMAQGAYTKAIENYEQSRVMQEAVYKNRAHPAVAATYAALGKVYHLQGKFTKALKYHEQSLSMRRSAYGPQAHPTLAASYASLGKIYACQGNYRSALTSYGQAMEMLLVVYNRQPHPDVATSYTLLGQVYNKIGEYNNALSHHERALGLHQQVYDEQPHPDVATNYQYIGDVHTSQGDYSKALFYYEKAFNTRKTVYSTRPHPDVATSYTLLGKVYELQGDYLKAHKHYEQALELFLENYKTEAHPDVASSYFHISTVYRLQGEAVKALAYCEKAFTSFDKIYGSHPHPDVAANYILQGNIHCAQGSYTKALSCYQRALGLYQEIYGSHPHPDLASSYGALGKVHALQGNHTKALTYHERAMEQLLSIHGKRAHPDLAYVHTLLGQVYALQGSYHRALASHDQALQLLVKVYGSETHHSVAQNYASLGNTYSLQEEYEKASESYNKAIKLFLKVYGKKTHPDVAGSYCQLGKIYCKQADYKNALKYCEEALEHFLCIYHNTPHPHVADSLVVLGDIFRAQGRYPIAQARYEQALEIRRCCFGVDHLATQELKQTCEDISGACKKI